MTERNHTGLTKLQFSALRMRAQGLKVSEIAENLNCPLPYAKNVLRRACLRLRVDSTTEALTELIARGGINPRQIAGNYDLSRFDNLDQPCRAILIELSDPERGHSLDHSKLGERFNYSSTPDKNRLNVLNDFGIRNTPQLTVYYRAYQGLVAQGYEPGTEQPQELVQKSAFKPGSFEFRVLELILLGNKTRDIALITGRAVSTVKNKLALALSTSGFSCKEQAVLTLVRKGLINPQEIVTETKLNLESIDDLRSIQKEILVFLTSPGNDIFGVKEIAARLCYSYSYINNSIFEIYQTLGTKNLAQTLVMFIASQEARKATHHHISHSII